MIPDDLDSGPLLNAFQPPQVTLVQGGRVRVLQGRRPRATPRPRAPPRLRLPPRLGQARQPLNERDPGAGRPRRVAADGGD
jgi:hypothetical protein